MHLTTVMIKVCLTYIALGCICLGVFSAQANTAVKNSDVRFIIDVSGSMKKNDPNNLRQPAVDLLVELLPEGSKAGVWTFGKYVNMLIPHKVVDEEWRKMARIKANEINSVGLFTNIGGALEKAVDDIARLNDNYKTSVILLTDGMVDVSKSPEDNQKEWRRIVDKVLPELKKAGVTIHTVALSENADINLLEKMSVMTDGTTAVAYNPEDLMKIFLKAFDIAAPSQQVPLTDNAFAVDSSVEEFTALIFRMDSAEQTQLVGPDELVYTSTGRHEDVSWLRTERYDLITVNRPVEGEWKLQANIDPDSRVTIVSDMRLKVKTLPNNVFKGGLEKLSFVLQEEGKTITRPDFLSLLNSSVSVAYGPKETTTGQIWNHNFDSKVNPAKGVFQVELPEFKNIGVYDISVLVDGKTFKRTFEHRITVREPFTASLEESMNENGAEEYILTVRSHSDAVDIKRTQIVATVVNPQRRKVVKPLGFTQFDHWQTMLHADIPGTYNITVQIAGVDKTGQSFEYSLVPLTIKYNPNKAFSESEPEVIAQEVIAEPVPDVPRVEEKSDESNIDEPVPTELVETPVADDSLPSWLMYSALAFGNLFILGGGYFLFRKLSSPGSEEDALSELSEVAIGGEDENIPEPPLEPLEESPEAVVSMSMENTATDDDSPPPMEDLDGILSSAVDEDEDMAQAMSMEAETVEDSSRTGDDIADDFGVDDIEDDESFDEGQEDEDHEDMEAAMRKAQGLDLSDDELDDAINHLIDDLDDSRDVDDSSGVDDDLDDLSGIDFDEDK